MSDHEAREALARLAFPAAFKRRIDMRPMAYEAADRILAAGWTRALTAPVVTDEMVERARLAFNGTPRRQSIEDAIRAALTAALQPGGGE